VRFPLPEGSSVVVDVGDDVHGVVRASRATDTIADAVASFQDGLGAVSAAAGVALRRLREMPSRPDSVEVEFGVRLTAEAGAVIAKTAIEGNFQVRLSWTDLE
jgi:hypothetical protein